MIQLNKYLKDGTIELLEVPFPAIIPGAVLVKNLFSAISTGTEGKTIKDAKLGYLGKAKARKEEVKKVIDSAQTHGVVKTYQMVMNKLEAPSPLGYSCVGEVIAVGDDIKTLKIGDLVACGGNTANHAEVISVPKNLCVKLNDKKYIKQAAYTTIGAVAMQGVRQASLSIGEKCAVIGLGLIGQITMQILSASGVTPIGIDISQETVDLANKHISDSSHNRSIDNIEELIKIKTGGLGVDAVIITAGTNSDDPINLAGELCRQKGKVIVVGAVPTGFKRKQYFQKELSVIMSCSYGPGRYDDQYEQQGIDYPVGYVRWTENRNMQAFVDLIETNKVSLDHLITHEFDFNNVADAYDLITESKEFFSGIIVKYDSEKIIENAPIVIRPNNIISNSINVGFIGAGSFAQNFVLPCLKNKVNFVGIATAKPNNAKNIGDKYQFHFCTGKSEDIINSDEINSLFILTPHHLHAQQVIEGIKARKNVFVEKPLCLKETELELIKDTVIEHKGNLSIGFNRRFSPAIKKVKDTLDSSTPVAINYRINAGILPANHWVHNPKIGGGRIIGEVCHFIDLCYYIAKSPIKIVSATVLNDNKSLNDSLAINLEFDNGSIASISYFSNGSKNLNKEYLEIFSGGTVISINDFKNMSIHGKSTQTNKFSKQDKGYNNQFDAYIKGLKNNTPIIEFNDIYHSTLATFKVLESIEKKQSIHL